MTDERPDPDELLARAEAEEAEARRGKLRIFFGFAAGVGKTYAMLEAAQRERADNVDVAIGYIEHHGRPETEALAQGLEVIPPRLVPYRGVILRELDLDAALARRPQLILVDELAHTNAEGLRHAKRWQDVEELLDAGIDVYSTLNVQHVESLNDVIAQITGVVVRETLPDSVLERADDIELIDLTPEELIERLKEGKVYISQQAERALQNFFQKSNLQALRELSMRQVARRLQRDVDAARQEKAASAPWATAERLLVCIGPSPTSAKVVRAARRLADSLGAEWVAVHVETPQSIGMSPADRARLLAHLRLAERLGAETATLSGEVPVAETIEYAQRRNVTKIVVGKSGEPRGLFRRPPSLVNRLIRDSGEIDIYVIRGAAEPGTLVVPSRRPEFRWRPWLGTAAVLAFCTAINMLWHGLGLTETNLVMTYLLGVVFVAFRYGRGPSIAASILAVVLFDVFFTRPYYTVVVEDTQYVITFAVMLLVGLVTAALAGRSRAQAELSRRNERRTEALYRLGRKLAGIMGQNFLAAEAERAVSEMFSAEAVVLLPSDGNLRPVLDHQAGFTANPSEIAVAQWVYDHGQLAGRGTDTLPGAQALYLPLTSPHAAVGVLGVRSADPDQLLLPDSRQLLEAFTTQVALAIERDRLTLQMQSAHVQAETEQLRSTLLASVSHDLRTPLAVIAGASSTLLERQATADPQTQRELLETIFEESDRLSRLVENLLRLTQLSSGHLRVEKDWHPVEDVIGSALRRLERTLVDRPVNVDLPDDVLLGQFDAVLIEQLLYNLLENAARYTPAGTPIDISARREGNSVVVEIADRGPGLRPDEITRIFETFQRGSQTKADSRGAGLGLAICRAVVQAHGGRITASNREGGGAVFRIELPSAAPPLPLDLDANEPAQEAACD